jgi:hypothetical protein
MKKERANGYERPLCSKWRSGGLCREKPRIIELQDKQSLGLSAEEEKPAIGQTGTPTFPSGCSTSAGSIKQEIRLTPIS